MSRAVPAGPARLNYFIYMYQVYMYIDKYINYILFSLYIHICRTKPVGSCRALLAASAFRAQPRW